MKVAGYLRAEEGSLGQHRLVNHNRYAFGLDALHDALHAAGSVVVRAGLHYEPVDADGAGLALEDAAGDKVFAGAVCFNNSVNEVLRHVFVVGQQLLGVFGEAVAAKAKTGVVVVLPNSGVKAHAFDDLAGV